MTQKKLISSVLCLNFSNNFGNNGSFDFEDLVNWAKYTGAISNDSSVRLIKYSSSYPFKTAPIVVEARVLAKTIARIFLSVAKRQPPLKDDLNFLNGSFEKTFPNLKLVLSPSNSFHWGWSEPTPIAPDQVLWRVILSAGETLIKETPTRIKMCAAETCIKLFLDTSKGGQRKWCSMETCGNRLKTRKYREKIK